MRKVMKLEPDGWPCSLRECPPGAFLYRMNFGFKTNDEEKGVVSEAFTESGEACCLGEDAMVQPLKVVWDEEDE